MKNRQFILWVVVVSIFIQACQKDTDSYPGSLDDKISHNTGTITADLNGKPWIATVARAYYLQGRIGIVAEHYLNEDLHEALSLTKISQVVQLNTVHYRNPYTYEYVNPDGVHALFAITEDDANLANYSVIPDSFANNYVEITSYNDITHEIKGRFQISFYRTYTVENGVYDTVRFTDGAFSLKMINQ